MQHSPKPPGCGYQIYPLALLQLCRDSGWPYQAQCVSPTLIPSWQSGTTFGSWPRCSTRFDGDTLVVHNEAGPDWQWLVMEQEALHGGGASLSKAGLAQEDSHPTKNLPPSLRCRYIAQLLSSKMLRNISRDDDQEARGIEWCSRHLGGG